VTTEKSPTVITEKSPTLGFMFSLDTGGPDPGSQEGETEGAPGATGVPPPAVEMLLF